MKPTPNITGLKFCKGCQQDKPLDDYSLARNGLYGRAFYCRPCAAAAGRARYARTATAETRKAAAARMRVYLSDPEKAEKDRASSLEWYRNHSDVVKARSAAWAKANPERFRASVERYRQKPEYRVKALEYRHRRIARLAEAPVNDFTADQWCEVQAEFNHACAYCLTSGVPLQQEHMQPISRGGSHTKSNIVPACGPCNMRKGTRDLLESLVLNRSE